MQYRRIGTSGLQVSSLCLGAMTFGTADEKSFMHGASADEATSFAILDRAKELGINFVDTADVYGQDGLSERVTGKWLKERNARDSPRNILNCNSEGKRFTRPVARLRYRLQPQAEAMANAHRQGDDERAAYQHLCN